MHGTQYGGAKFVGRKGNIPDSRLRSPNVLSVEKVVVIHKHLGGRLRSSHP